MTSFYQSSNRSKSTAAPVSVSLGPWYTLEELNGFEDEPSNGGGGGGAAPSPSHAPWQAITGSSPACSSTCPPQNRGYGDSFLGTSGEAATTTNSRTTAAATPTAATTTATTITPTSTTAAASRPATTAAPPPYSAQPSFYGQGAKHTLRSSRPPPSQSFFTNQEDSDGTGRHNGNAYSALPKRPQRQASCRSIDREISSAAGFSQLLAMVSRVEELDGANYANLLYALAHCKKQGGKPVGLLKDDRWISLCDSVATKLSELTARDAANAMWSLATLDIRDSPLLEQLAETLCDAEKLAVCDPVSVSKAAWSLTGIASRDQRLAHFSKLAVPIVLRAETFPVGALTMTCYAFAKADHRDADVYEALSSALERHPEDELRPIDVCNVIWAFSTVGYRDDHLFERFCKSHLERPEIVKNFNPQDITNTTWGFCKVGYVNEEAMRQLALAGMNQREVFKPIHFSNFFYSFAMLRLVGPEGFVPHMAAGALQKLHTFDSGNLAILVWALAQLKETHPVVDAALARLKTPEICLNLSSRARSMLFLGFFRLGRPEAVDEIFDATIAAGSSVGASGYSAVMMSAEQGADGDRERRLQMAMAEEAQDDRMYAAIGNSLAIRLWKRGRSAEALQFLRQHKATMGRRRWSSVSAGLLKRLTLLVEGEYENDPSEDSEEALAELWEAPVKSGIHPIAATRQNEGPHAYTREFMTLQAVLCGAPRGDVDACMAAIEHFAESRSLWLKITAWEKAVVVHEVAKLSRPKVAIEIGAYVGYSAMNVARAIRPYGGRVVSLEVDPMHVTIVRNMVEYAGLSDNVDVYTGYCFDVIPHLLDLYGPKSVGMVFMDQKGTRFHTDLALMEELGLLADGAVILADNVLKPGAPLYIWHLMHGPYTTPTAISVREFLLQSEDWMVMGFYDEKADAVKTPPPTLNRVAFESDAFRKRSMFDAVAPSKSDWWAFSNRFVEGLVRAGCKPPVVGLHGRDNPVIQPHDIAGIFRRAGRLPPGAG